jgi:hypothetical protein
MMRVLRPLADGVEAAGRCRPAAVLLDLLRGLVRQEPRSTEAARSWKRRNRAPVPLDRRRGGR